MQRYKIQVEYSTIKDGEMQTKNELFFISSNEDITFAYIERVTENKYKNCDFISIIISEIKNNSIMVNLINNNQ